MSSSTRDGESVDKLKVTGGLESFATRAWQLGMEALDIVPTSPKRLSISLYLAKEQARRRQRVAKEDEEVHGLIVMLWKTWGGVTEWKLWDPTARVNGILHVNMIEEYGDFIADGTVLILDGVAVRNPSKKYDKNFTTAEMRVHSSHVRHIFRCNGEAWKVGKEGHGWYIARWVWYENKCYGLLGKRYAEAEYDDNGCGELTGAGIRPDPNGEEPCHFDPWKVDIPFLNVPEKERERQRKRFGVKKLPNVPLQ